MWHPPNEVEAPEQKNAWQESAGVSHVLQPWSIPPLVQRGLGTSDGVDRNDALDCTEALAHVVWHRFGDGKDHHR